jgi:hypothetical protein
VHRYLDLVDRQGIFVGLYSGSGFGSAAVARKLRIAGVALLFFEDRPPTDDNVARLFKI